MEEFKKEALDALGVYRRNMSHIVGKNDEAVKAIETCIRLVDEIEDKQQWIPIKMRPMDEEEREYWEDHFGYELADEDAVLFDCKMPDDGQEILVSYHKWISMDKCEVDDGCYGLEGNGDWDGVVAWMPLPEIYRGEENGTGSI